MSIWNISTINTKISRIQKEHSGQKDRAARAQTPQSAYRRTINHHNIVQDWCFCLQILTPWNAD